jgi:hypothetical protein
MGHRWVFLLTALVAVPLLLGCGSSSSSNSGLTEAELAKIMESAKTDPSYVPIFETPAEELLALLISDPQAAAKRALAENRRIVTGVVVSCSPDESDGPFLMLDGGTHQGKTFKVRFNFTDRHREELKSVKVGDSVRVAGNSDGEIKEETLEFNECVLSPATQAADGDAAGAREKQDPKP